MLTKDAPAATVDNTRQLSLLSPQRLIILSALILVAFTFVPPRTYSAYIDEVNYMFLNVELLLYVVGCFALIYLGTSIGARLKFPAPRCFPKLLGVSPFSYLFWPVALALGLVVATVAIILKNEPWLIATALVGDGQEVKNMMATATQGAMTGTLPLAMAICWWSYAQFLKMRLHMRRLQRSLCWMLIFTLAGFLFVAYAITLARYLLMPLIFGMFLLRIRAKLSEGVPLKRLLLPAAIFGVFVLVLFGAIAAMRTKNGGGGVIGSFIGYGPTSMNHLAALMEGKMRPGLLQDYFDMQNFGFYYKFPFVERLYDLSSMYDQAHDAPFNTTWRAGLNGAYIWITSLGEIGYGLGVFALLYFVIYGYLVGRAWAGFKSGTTFGSIMYPWAAFCILFAFGSNYFAGRNLSVMLLACGLLWMYTGSIRPRFAGAVGAI